MSIGLAMMRGSLLSKDLLASKGSAARACRQPWCIVAFAACAALWAWAGSLAAEPPRFEAAAARLQANTLTVRCIPLPKPRAAGEDGGDEGLKAGGETPAAVVRVCSGVALGGGLVVTHADVSEAEIRVTLPGGEQAQARLRVFDRYSGLSLLETEDRKLSGLPLASEPPAIGGWVLSAAAWGAERAVVAAGILSAAERALPGATYPPLLQCDIRTADTSSGAALVNELGELVGLVVATDSTQAERGWAYAVPATHVKRLQRTLAEAGAGQLVVLARLRPVVGLVLAAGTAPDEVVVQRVSPGGPAAKAGVQVGDRILAAEGLKIRSVYEAERPVLHKQPGDPFTLSIERGGKTQLIEVVLGGGAEMPASFALRGGLVRPALDIENLAPGRYLTRNGQGAVREVAIPTPGENSAEGEEPATPEESVRLLEKAVDRYRGAVEYLQAELARSQREQAETAEKLRALSAELENFKRQLAEQKQQK